jgi:hypothetical protein
MSDLLASSCGNCGSTLPSYAFSFCPDCGNSVVDHRSVVRGKMASGISKIAGKPYSNLLTKLPRNSEVLSGAIRNLGNAVDSDVCKIPVVSATNALKDPKVVAVARGLARKSPEIAEVLIGFTPLAPYSRLIGNLLERATKQKNDEGTVTSELPVRFCFECGLKLKPSCKFCSKCGTKQMTD